MTTLTTEARRVIVIVDDIDGYNKIISEIEAQICDEGMTHLEEEQQRLQRQVNEMVNSLKSDGYEVDYDGDVTFVMYNDAIWLEYRGAWVEHEKRYEGIGAISFINKERQG